jgi:hypothetical protein
MADTVEVCHCAYPKKRKISDSLLFAGVSTDRSTVYAVGRMSAL